MAKREEQLHLLACFGRECKRLAGKKSEFGRDHWIARYKETRDKYIALKAKQ